MERLNIKTTAGSGKKKSAEVPSIPIDSKNEVLNFTNAASALAKATDDYEKARAVVEEIGLREILKANIRSYVSGDAKVISSIKIVDKSGERALITFQDKYAIVDLKGLQSWLADNDENPSDFVHYVGTAKFDNKIFFDSDGTFNVKVFKAYQRAIDRTTTELIEQSLLPADTESPLVTDQVAAVKDDFHEKRWTVTGAFLDQLRLHGLARATVAVKAVID